MRTRNISSFTFELTSRPVFGFCERHATTAFFSAAVNTCAPNAASVTSASGLYFSMVSTFTVLRSSRTVTSMPPVVFRRGRSDNVMNTSSPPRRPADSHTDGSLVVVSPGSPPPLYRVDSNTDLSRPLHRTDSKAPSSPALYRVGSDEHPFVLSAIASTPSGSVAVAVMVAASSGNRRSESK